MMEYLSCQLGVCVTNGREHSFSGAKGAKLVFIATIIGIVGAVIGAFVSIVSEIVAIAVVVMTIIGWIQIKNADVVENDAITE